MAPKVEETAAERAAAESRARTLAATSVLQGRLRAPSPMSPPLAAALLSLGCSEIGARLATLESSNAAAGAAAAGAELLSVSALMGGAIAALSSALHDAAARAGE